MAEIDAPPSSSAPTLLSFCASQGNLRRAIRTSLIVGPILTIINQTAVAGALLSFEPVGAAALVRMALTFAVPFLVSLFSSAAADKARWTSAEEQP